VMNKKNYQKKIHHPPCLFFLANLLEAQLFFFRPDLKKNGT